VLSFAARFAARSLRADYAHVQLGRSVRFQPRRWRLGFLRRRAAPTTDGKITFPLPRVRTRHFRRTNNTHCDSDQDRKYLHSRTPVRSRRETKIKSFS